MAATSHTTNPRVLAGIIETREDVAQFWYSLDQSRTRVYPQNIANTITLTPNAASNIFGAWKTCPKSELSRGKEKGRVV